MITTKPGWDSRGAATFEVSEDYDRIVASYELKYLSDTNEVVLVKTSGDEPEAVYSEVLT